MNLSTDKEVKWMVALVAIIMLYWVNIGGAYRVRHSYSHSATQITWWFN